MAEGDQMRERVLSTTPVKSAVRTAELLDYLARNEGPHSLTALQQQLGYPKSSLHVLLRTLVDLGWLETDITGTLYRIGMRALLAGTSYINTDEVVRLSREVLDWVAEETTQTVHLARLDDTDIVYLATRASRHYLRPFSRVGQRLPAYATSLGKALLAARTDGEVRGLLPDPMEALTPNTLTDIDALLADLSRTRERGYSIDHEENTLGLMCFGVALPYREPPRDAISCSIPVALMDPEQEQQIPQILLEARARLAEGTQRLRRTVLPG
jgi:IclR family transcriptional regulator, acetate operon repressor